MECHKFIFILIITYLGLFHVEGSKRNGTEQSSVIST